MQLKRILYPTDFSPPSQEAWQVARALARQNRAELIVLHVDAPSAAIPLPVTSGYGLPVQFAPEARVEQAEHVLEHVFKAEEDLIIRRMVASGDPAEQIVKLAEQENVDLIVMGTHGHTGMLRLLMGSVAEAVLRRAPCPVLTLRDRNPPPEKPEKS